MKCKCEIHHKDKGKFFSHNVIARCPLCKAAPALLAACKAIRDVLAVCKTGEHVSPKWLSNTVKAAIEAAKQK